MSFITVEKLNDKSSSYVCRGGAELLFDKKKRHELDLPGDECKYVALNKCAIRSILR